MGPAFTVSESNDLAVETTHIAVALMGARTEHTWHGESPAVDFYDIKGLAEAILTHSGLSADYRHVEIAPYETGQCAEIELKGGIAGFLGRIDPAIAEAFDITQPLYLLDLNVTTVWGQPKPEHPFAPVPKFPPSLMDMAVVVSSAVRAEDVRKAAEKAGGKRLKQAEIFDVYQGDQIESGKKSIALKLVFQVPDRTLTDKETTKDFEKIQATLAHEFDATLR
jgi:phenylalanyl-tRNA synthetase beta chain